MECCLRSFSYLAGWSGFSTLDLTAHGRHMPARALQLRSGYTRLHGTYWHVCPYETYTVRHAVVQLYALTLLRRLSHQVDIWRLMWCAKGVFVAYTCRNRAEAVGILRAFLRGQGGLCAWWEHTIVLLSSLPC